MHDSSCKMITTRKDIAEIDEELKKARNPIWL